MFDRLAGYEDVNNAKRLVRDPAIRGLVDRSGLDLCAASTSQIGRFETEWLSGEGGSAYNGHFACTCYRPLFVFNLFSDFERGAPRPGNVDSVDGWRDVLKPVIARYRHKMKC